MNFDKCRVVQPLPQSRSAPSKLPVPLCNRPCPQTQCLAIADLLSASLFLPFPEYHKNETMKTSFSEHNTFVAYKICSFLNAEKYGTVWVIPQFV